MSATRRTMMAGLCLSVASTAAVLIAQQAQQGQPPPTQPTMPAAAATPPADDPIRTMVSRLELEKYKATIKGLTQFGDRRQGTKRNRDALDWIEAQLKSFGCTNTERITYMHPSAEARDPNAPQRGAGAGAAGRGGQGRGAGAGAGAAGDEPPAAGAGGGRGGGGRIGPLAAPVRNSQGGSTLYGNRGRTGVYQPPAEGATPNPNAPPPTPLDPRLLELNKEPAPPNDPPSQRQDVYCTKVGTTHPEEMYIVGAHMDGHGWGEAANDDGSGTALVMELARVFSSPDVQTERTIRFALWNNEETGLNGAWAYVNQRKGLQGKEDPAGSGKYPGAEVARHDPARHDALGSRHAARRRHTQPRAAARSRRERRMAEQLEAGRGLDETRARLQAVSRQVHDGLSRDVGPHMTNTDSTPFMDLVPAISLRENERGMQTGAGWNPTWHQPIDVFTTFSDKDFKLGLNAAQTTLVGDRAADRSDAEKVTAIGELGNGELGN